jgi:hypothetical protein
MIAVIYVVRSVTSIPIFLLFVWSISMADFVSTLYNVEL